jgi:hypothetical protein
VPILSTGYPYITIHVICAFQKREVQVDGLSSFLVGLRVKSFFFSFRRFENSR